MTAQAEDILAWLETAITAREAVARDASRAYGAHWVRPVNTDEIRLSDSGIWFQALSDEIAEHIVYNSPEVVLRRCAADRKLLELHGGFGHACPARDEDGDLDDHVRFYNHEVCPVVRLLAEGYGWAGEQR